MAICKTPEKFAAGSVKNPVYHVSQLQNRRFCNWPGAAVRWSFAIISPVRRYNDFGGYCPLLLGVYVESWFASLSGTDRFFLVCALVGSFGVLLRLVTQVLGFAGGSLDGDIDIDHGGGADAHHDGDGFKIISIHGLAAFFMMFGWVGFAAQRESQTSVFVSIILGVIAGALAVWLMAKLFGMANRLQSVGNLDVNKAVGCPGTVYMTIPKGGTGRVVINIAGRQREMDAVHLNGEELATGAPIVVARIEENVAVVDSAAKNS
jgi:membrane protein implicated in regulation of membrane protease activity